MLLDRPGVRDRGVLLSQAQAEAIGRLQLIQLVSPGIVALWVLWALAGDTEPNQYGAVPSRS